MTEQTTSNNAKNTSPSSAPSVAPNKQHSLKKLQATLVLIAFLVTSASIAFAIKIANTKFSDGQDQNQNANSENSARISIGNTELEAILEKTEGTTIVLFGKPTCPACAQFFPILDKVLAENSTAPVYYYNTDAASSDNPEKFSAILSRLQITAVPSLIKVKNGQKLSELQAQGYSSEQTTLKFIQN